MTKPICKIVYCLLYIGDIAFRFLHHLESSTSSQNVTDRLKYKNNSQDSGFNITVCDINENMLRVGQERSKNYSFHEKIQWRVGNAEELQNEQDESYDVYTIAFGIRNCTNLDKVVKEAYRVLKPGGRFLCMEFSKVDNQLLKQYSNCFN